VNYTKIGFLSASQLLKFFFFNIKCDKDIETQALLFNRTVLTNVIDHQQKWHLEWYFELPACGITLFFY